MKKTLALVLAVIMAVSMLTVFAVSSSAADAPKELKVEPYFDKIENWGGKSYFIVGISGDGLADGEVDDILGKAYDGTYKVTLWVVGTGDQDEDNYVFDYKFTNDGEIYKGIGFFRFAVAEYGVKLEKNGKYTIKQLIISDAKTGEVKYVGASEAQVFESSQTDKYLKDGPIAPETTYPLNSVNPVYGGIENWGGKTYFIAQARWDTDMSKQKAVYDGLKAGDYKLKVALTDETAGKTYKISSYDFSRKYNEEGKPDGNSFYGSQFFRLAFGEYGINADPTHAYTLKLKITDKDGKTVLEGTSPKGAFVSNQTDGFLKDGPIVPEAGALYEVDPETGDTAVIATIVAVVALAAMAVVVKKVRV